MPRIFDNIEQRLINALQETLEVSERADFSVGYFNLRGWRTLDSYIEAWTGDEGKQCRLLVGMQKLPQEETRDALALVRRNLEIDQQTALRLKKKLAEDFKEQLSWGIPTNQDEEGLRRLARQLKARKVVVKLFLKHPLHAKLYLCFRQDKINPIVGYLGSSNLTLAGLSAQGELNIDVLDGDAAQKLAKWFEDRWNDRWCLDITDELVKIIETSWAREEAIPPYHIYIKMAYHLSQEARAGLSEFRIPREFEDKLFEFQSAAVRIAAHHIHKRGGVLLGDVVGLGKTLMATAIARILEEDFDYETLILCPKNLVPMWEAYREEYRLRAKIISITNVINELPKTRRYRLVVIDESHNLRNREGRRFRVIQDYIQQNESKCILLSATPYNKTYLDLANQLRLFVPEDKDLGIRPEFLLKELGGETEFIRRHQCPVKSLAAFEKSECTDDWRELMRLYMVRRTRSFIQENYAQMDSENDRKYLTFEDGTRSYFPTRIPKTIKFKSDEKDNNDQFAKLYSDEVVNIINSLNLPRYGLGNYIAAKPHQPPTQEEAKHLQDLSRAGKRLMGFCRTNLFKRLESSGQSFLQSVERHILRNFIFLHALENDLPIPIGKQGAEFFDSRLSDEDADTQGTIEELLDPDENVSVLTDDQIVQLFKEKDFQNKSAEIYQQYASVHKHRFKWLRTSFFVKSLATDLKNDAQELLKVFQLGGQWDPKKDIKLEELVKLIAKIHPKEKILVFTQFADTVRYLEANLQRLLPKIKIKGVTGDDSDPTKLAWRFSPISNHKKGEISSSEEFQVLIATDVLSEGQNLQDCAIVVNFDLPWAIIRLIQRAGRVDRIGQQADRILCYSFLPADGVEKIIRLRARVKQRLKENDEVIGADEAFFEDQLKENNSNAVRELYHEKSGILDDEDDNDVDLASYAYQIWQNAITQQPDLQKDIPDMPPVVYSARSHVATEQTPHGVLVYLRTAQGNDALAWVNQSGESVTESQFAILRAAECSPDTPSMPRMANHHELVHAGAKLIAEEEKSSGGQLGRPSGARFRAYERLKHYAEDVKGMLFDTPKLHKTIDEIYRYPLRSSATDTLNRHLRSGISDESLAELAQSLQEENRLCIIHDDEQSQEPQIICSLGLVSDKT